MLTGGVDGDHKRRVRIVWPSLGTTLANMHERSVLGNQWYEDSYGQPHGPAAQWEGKADGGEWAARAHFSHHVMPWAHRARTYHHCKVSAAFDERHRLVWLFAGRPATSPDLPRSPTISPAGLAPRGQPQLLWRGMGQGGGRGWGFTVCDVAHMGGSGTIFVT